MGNWLDIVGDYDDIVGASKAQMAPAKRPLPSWMRRSTAVSDAVPTSPMIASEGAGVPRVLPLPLPLTTINPGVTQTITQRAQIPLRAQRVVLTSSVTPSSVQVQIFVGVQPQTVAAGFVPLDIYRPTAFDVSLVGNTLQVGNDFSVQAQNTGAVAETVGGALIGIALQP